MAGVRVLYLGLTTWYGQKVAFTRASSAGSTGASESGIFVGRRSPGPTTA
jgi:hypothetical protein